MKIVFFGVGAVCSVIARAIYELNEKSLKDKIDFVFVARDKKRVKSHFFRNQEILENAEILEVENFEDIFSNPLKYKHFFKKSSIFINSSVPSYNLPIMHLALEFDAN